MFMFWKRNGVHDVRLTVIFSPNNTLLIVLDDIFNNDKAPVFYGFNYYCFTVVYGERLRAEVKRRSVFLPGRY